MLRESVQVAVEESRHRLELEAALRKEAVLEKRAEKARTRRQKEDGAFDLNTLRRVGSSAVGL